MASLAPARAPAPVYDERPRRSRPPSRKAAVRRQRRMAGSVVWICVIAVLLAGVVAVNVAVLRLNLTLDDLSHDRAKLQADNAALQLQLSSASASARIERAAEEHGLVPVDPSQTRYVELAAAAK